MERVMELPAIARKPLSLSNAVRLFLVSSAALYLEIMLIRWLGTEVKIFAFFQNLALIVCYLGFGIGCLTSHKRGSLLQSLIATTSLVVMVCLPYPQWQKLLYVLSSMLSWTPDAALWGTLHPLQNSVYIELFIVSLAIVSLFLLLIAIAMIPLGRWVGYSIESAQNTVSFYSINLAGSLAGIWLFALLAAYWLPPAYWFSVAFLLIVISQPMNWRSILISSALLAVVLVSLHIHTGGEVYWSPYQKLTVTPQEDQQYLIDVNNEGYMTIANASPNVIAAHPDLARSYEDSSYDSPFRFMARPDRVLVVGSGAGNDIAAALRHGASHVDAVEIDPAIASIGKRLHPEHPYSSPKVHFIENDARNFMRKSKDRYNLILFGLLDSHTEFSGYSNVRVDNFVYTKESFQEARNLLTPGGTLVIKFEVRRPWTWMGQRFYSILSDVFEHPPVTYFVPEVGWLTGATVFIESNSALPPAIEPNAKDAAFLLSHKPDFPLTTVNAPVATTDDWPYIYHLSHSIPRTYFSVSIIIVLLALYMVSPFLKSRQSGSFVFFLLGGGFLLMETQMVSRLALYFGTTWMVNCVALSGILVVLILANFYVRFIQPRRLMIYDLALCVALLATYITPWDRIPGSGALIGMLICVAYCISLFLAGVIFTESLRRTQGNSKILGMNMLGAVAGGLLQNVSFLAGMKSLLLLAAGIYILTALFYAIRRTSPLAA